VPALLTAAVCLAAAAGWVAAGSLATLAGLDALELPARAAGVLVAVAALEAAQAKLMSRQSGHV
jgi:hypothetical protein